MPCSVDVSRTCSCFVAASSTNIRLSGSSSERISSSTRTGVRPVERVTNIASASFRDRAIVRDCPREARFWAGLSFRRISRSSLCGPITVTPCAISRRRNPGKAFFISCSIISAVMALTSGRSSEDAVIRGRYSSSSLSPLVRSLWEGTACSLSPSIDRLRESVTRAPSYASRSSQNVSSSGSERPSRTLRKSWLRWVTT